ncbi:hypothetical protein Hanom_Chr05g00396121 [Helianthus anomalus]
MGRGRLLKLVDVVVDAEKVTSPEVVDGAGNPQTPEVVAQYPEKGKTAEEIPVTTSHSMASGFMLENVEDQGSFSDADKNSPIRPDETLGIIIIEHIRRRMLLKFMYLFGI